MRSLRTCFTCGKLIWVEGPAREVFSSHHHYHHRGRCAALFVDQLERLARTEGDEGALERVRELREQLEVL